MWWYGVLSATIVVALEMNVCKLVAYCDDVSYLVLLAIQHVRYHATVPVTL